MKTEKIKTAEDQKEIMRTKRAIWVKHGNNPDNFSAAVSHAMDEYAKVTIEEMVPDNFEKELFIRTPFSIAAQEIIRYTIEWYESQLTDKLQEDIKLDYSREDGK